MIDLPPGTWWPAAEGEAHAFHWRCRCGVTHDAWLSRSVDAQGVVGSALRCAACGFEDAARLVGWDAETHRPRPGPPPRPVRREMRHRCGARVRLDELSALALAHDPRALRGHWCPTCQRHGWNHEWVWIGTEEVVGEGTLGRVRYEELSEEEKRGLERQVGEIHADVKALVRRNAEREGAETAVEKSDQAAAQSRNRRAALFAGAVGGGVTLALQVAGRKLGLIQ